MVPSPQILTQTNQDNYGSLMVSIEASQGRTGVWIAVCDDVSFIEEIVNRYESELKQQDICTYRAVLNQRNPNLRATLENVVQENDLLRRTTESVVTILGVEQLFFLRLGAERSDWDIFFGYSQWNREAFRALRFPIVLWVSPAILNNLSKKAPDFWSWYSGVFQFSAPPQESTHQSNRQLLDIQLDNNLSLSLTSIEHLIQQKEEAQEHDTYLGQLYFWAGVVYVDRTKKGESRAYKQDIEKAVEYYQKALFCLPEEDFSFALALNNLALLYRSQGKYAEAESLCRWTLTINEKILGPEHPYVASTLDNLAGLYVDQGKYAEAEPLHLRALAIQEKVLGPEHLETATTLSNLAVMYYRLDNLMDCSHGRDDKAGLLILRALSIRERALDPDHPDVVTTLDNRAVLQADQWAYEAAEPLYSWTLLIRERTLGPEHPDVANTLNNLATLYKSQGEYAEAEALYLRALSIYEKTLGLEHPHVATTLNHLAEMYYTQGKEYQVEQLLIWALSIQENVLGSEHPDVAATLNNLVGLYYSQGKSDEAELLILRMLAIYEKVLGPEHLDVAQFLVNLGSLFHRQGKYAEAEALCLRGVLIALRILGSDDPMTLGLLMNFHTMLQGQGRYTSEKEFMQYIEEQLQKGEEEEEEE